LRYGDGEIEANEVVEDLVGGLGEKLDERMGNVDETMDRDS